MSENHMISSEVILKSKSGRSLTNEDSAITSENIDEYSPSDETILEAKQAFNKLGFSTPQSGITLTIVGQKSQFEKVFQIEITETRDETSNYMRIDYNKEPKIPPNIANIVEKIVFIPPPIHHL